jgi:superfamily II DNA/RNA helicase
VIQLGAPLSKSLNTHRIGRTSRSGSLGSALLIVLPFESSYVGGIARKFGFSDGQSEYAFHGKDHMQQARVTIRNQDKLRNNAESAYFSFIAYYLEYGPKDLKAHEILSAAEALATEVGLTQLPPLSDRLKQDLDKR